MRVSLNQITQYIDFELPPIDELVARINAQLGGVEEVIHLGERYDGAVVAKVVSCEKHENADKLSVCEIDAGTGENVQVVCGAPNVREGIFVVWLKPGATVPATFADKEPFVLEARELRGVVSNGMLASAKELGLGDSHDGILEIDPEEWKPSDEEIKPGASFAKTFGLDDTIIDIENKMFTHRPDLFGQIGVAREIAGIFGHEFEDKDWYWHRVEFENANDLELKVFNDAKENVPRFMAVAMQNIEVKPSPLWLQCALVAMGSKPINNIVDVTNYIMLITAQPTHAYDYDKLRGHTLGTRMAKQGEHAKLLNGKTYELTDEDIVIADGEGIVGLGGVMGGGNSEVSPDTKNIVLEVANFDMYAVRKSSMRHGLFTDALTRFNKGQSPLQNDRILNLLMMSVKDVSSNATQASAVADIMSGKLTTAHTAQSLSGTLKIEPEFINDRLGLELSSDEMEQLLRNVRFACYVDRDAGDSAISFTAPFWRTDIELPEDVVEEIGRVYGFDKLPRELPTRSMKPASQNKARVLKQAIRESLARSGANEVLTYSFVHESVIKKAGQKPSDAFKLSNALSPDLQYYRLSLLPSLLDKVHANIKSGYGEFVLFEIGKAHHKDNYQDDLPREVELVEAVYARKNKADCAPFYTLRRMVEQLLDDVNVAVSFEAIDSDMNYAGSAPFELSRSALIKTADGTVLGVVGELRQAVRQSFKLPDGSAAMTLDLRSLQAAHAGSNGVYTPLSRFPSVTQDISLKVAASAHYADIAATAQDILAEYNPSEFRYQLSPLSIYQADDDDAHKTITLRLTIASYDRTLTEADVTHIMDKIAASSAEKYAAQRV